MIIFRLDYILLKENEEGEASAIVLFCNIWPGYYLPTKVDLIRIYGKFGELNKGKKEMFNDVNALPFNSQRGIKYIDLMKSVSEGGQLT